MQGAFDAGPGAGAHEQVGASLRVFREFLREHDKTNEWGGLRMVVRAMAAYCGWARLWSSEVTFEVMGSIHDAAELTCLGSQAYIPCALAVLACF